MSVSAETATGFWITINPKSQLRVTTNPSVPGKILVDDIPRDEWGLNWMKIAPGTHAISFGDVPCLGTPPDVAVQTETGRVTEVEGIYRSMGSLRVTMDPPLPSTITVNGVPSNDWGVWLCVPPALYEVSFGPVAGFVPPVARTVTVQAGQVTHVVGTFQADPGSPGPDPQGYGLLRVVTRLDDGRIGAPTQILVDGIPRDEWGLAWLKIDPGSHTVAFTDVPGLGTPAEIPVLVSAGVAAEVVGVFGVHGYLRIFTCTVCPNPNTGVPATVFVDDIARNDYGMWQALPPSSYALSFGIVPGWTAPSAAPAQVVAGQLTECFADYSVGVASCTQPQPTGSLTNIGSAPIPEPSGSTSEATSGVENLRLSKTSARTTESPANAVSHTLDADSAHSNSSPAECPLIEGSSENLEGSS